jgi:S-(hydroxymethyl)glutathione dehydrogenase/alcohol dehydrogenase
MVVAAVLRETGGVPQLEEIDLAPPGPGQVRVKLAASGLCHSDLSLSSGTLRHALPVVLGHESAGRVVATGEGVQGLEVGDAVVLIWAPPCRSCWFCEQGEPYLCERADIAWHRPYAQLGDGTPAYAGLGVGGFATETVVDESACVPLPHGVPLVEAALLGCALLTGVGAIRHEARVGRGQSVLVLGLGGVGLSAVQGARIAGADRIIGVDPSSEKRALAQRLGATDVLEPGPDLAKRVRALCDGRGADHAIECVGRAETIRTAWSSTRRGGHTTVVGVGGGGEQVSLTPLEVARFARTLSGCVYGSADPFSEVAFLAEQYREGALDLGGLVTSRISLDEVGDAFAQMAAGRGARTLIVFDESL